MYKLNPNSNTSKFYSWIWNTEVTKFKTMCPYFWKYSLTILFLPVILFFKGVDYLYPEQSKIKIVKSKVKELKKTKLGTITHKTVKKIEEQTKFWNFLSKLLKWVYFIIIGIFIILGLFVLITTFISEPIATLAFIGGLTLFIGIVVGLVHVFSEYNIWGNLSYPFRLFRDMVISLYKNYCPMIKWDKNI